jgi:hypothetical protein
MEGPKNKNHPYIVRLFMQVGRDGLPLYEFDSEDEVEDVLLEEDNTNIVGADSSDTNLLLQAFYYDYKDVLTYNDTRHLLADGSFERFQATHRRYMTPRWGRSLLKHIIAGHVYFAFRRTPSFVAMYVGTDLTKPFKQAIRQCKERCVCTFSVTRHTRTMQYAFWCETCFPSGGPDGNMVICEPCAIKCHVGHDVSVRVNGKTGKFDKTFMFCDCGDVLDCKAQQF